MRSLFPEAIRLVEEARPSAVMLENVPGFASARFQTYRESLIQKLSSLGYAVDWRVLYASDFGVPQLRPRFILVGIKGAYAKRFRWPEMKITPLTVGESLSDIMASCGWPGTGA